LRDAAARQLCLRTTVPLKLQCGAVSPMVAGVLQPVVLLPSDAETWSLERRQQVLLHELAHVQRRDVLAQAIAGLACAMYWFNPLTWWGATQMKRLREIACDDAVVRDTTKPSNYAQTLLDVAKNYRCRRRSSRVAFACSMIPALMKSCVSRMNRLEPSRCNVGRRYRDVSCKMASRFPMNGSTFIH